MGIRYYAYPVRAELVDHARSDPRLFISDDPLMDAWGDPDDRPPMLYLDKAWRALQQLFVGRPCAAMVHGQVAMCGNGVEYHPWFGVLDPDEVAEVARDIVLVDEPVAVPGRRERVLFEVDYVSQYLGAAREFVCELADERSGLVYTIG
ncbi:YfbM family protein [Williamsia maris]|nr:YfbM family protein [Williamsia maris]